MTSLGYPCSRRTAWVQQYPHVRTRLGRAEQIALHLGAAQCAQPLLLLLRLDAFGRGRHIARGGDIHHRLHDRRRAVDLRDIADEAAVDLDLVEWETFQIAERGIAGAEIVQRDTNPDGA